MSRHPARFPVLQAVLAVALAHGLFAAPVRAEKPSVFINGVKVDGLADQTFKNVDVTFDAQGNIRITAKGYKISVDDADRAEEGAKLLKPEGEAKKPASGSRFFIATSQPRTGAAQWEVDVYINQVFVKKFRSKEPEPVFEITRFLKPGPNVVHFSARKEAMAEGERISTSPNDWIELTLGDGEMRSGQVMLNRLTTYRRTAAEKGTFDSETTINLGRDAETPAQ